MKIYNLTCECGECGECGRDHTFDPDDLPCPDHLAKLDKRNDELQAERDALDEKADDLALKLAEAEKDRDHYRDMFNVAIKVIVTSRAMSTAETFTPTMPAQN